MASSGTILHMLSGDLWGGREIQVAMLLSALKAKGVNVELLAFCDNNVTKEFSRRAIPVHICREDKGIVALAREVKQKIQSIKPQLIVSHGYKEHVLAALMRRPFVAMFHGASEPYHGLKGLKSGWHFWLGKSVAANLARATIFVSEDLRLRLGFARRANAHVFRNMIELDKPPEQSPQLLHPAVVWVGRLVQVKRLDILLRAASVLKQHSPTIHFYILGEGPESEELHKLASELELHSNVHFLGFQANAAAYISAADVFAITSDHEGIPTVLLEALLAGKKIVSSAVGGIPEVLEQFSDYPYLAFPRGDAHSCAQMIEQQLQRPSGAANGAEVIRTQFAPDVIASQHMKLYADVLGSLI